MASGDQQPSSDARLLHFETYDDYRAAQIETNHAKAENVWVSDRELMLLADYVRRNIKDARRGVCHGVRTGYEVERLRELLEIDVIGTEIADSDAPHVVRCDYHDRRDEWIGAFDFVYSNSWDHSYDPDLMLERWLESLTPAGRLFLEWTPYHEPASVGGADCFGATIHALRDFIRRHAILEAELRIRRPFGWRSQLPRGLRRLAPGARRVRVRGWRLLVVAAR